MNNTIINKLIAVIAIISGVLLFIGWTLNINRDSLVGAMLLIPAYILSMFAFLGIYSKQKEQLLSLIGFSLIIIATTLFIPWVVLDIARLAEIIPAFEWKKPEEVYPTRIIGIIGGVSYVLGFIIFGIAIIKGKVFKWWIGALLILASVVPLFHSILGIGKLLVRIEALTLIAFGWNILSSARINKKQKNEQI
ncbi:MAG: hypothetical protein WAO74_11545 [Polaribacter sp.]|uniref:hypothetical protein n=1 Tax=Polaribacter sp. TaxID=1920175 RepID=UPI003BB0B95B